MLVGMPGAQILYVAIRKPQKDEARNWTMTIFSVGSLLILAVAAIGVIWVEPFTSWVVPIPTSLRTFGLVLMVVAIALQIWAHIHLGANYGLGVRLRRGHQFVDTGPYAFVSHPIYLAVFIACGAGVIMTGNIMLTILAVLYCLVLRQKATQEEILLAQRFGTRHLRSRVVTPRFFPRPW